MTRAADCHGCGATTIIQLAQDSIRLPSGEALRRADAR
jgi:hypothetical protein